MMSIPSSLMPQAEIIRTSAARASASDTFSTAMQASASRRDAAAELDAYVKMSPAQRLRWQILEKLGISEQELASMAPEQRKVYEEKIRELMDLALGKKRDQQSAPAAPAVLSAAQSGVRLFDVLRPQQALAASLG